MKKAILALLAKVIGGSASVLSGPLVSLAATLAEKLIKSLLKRAAMEGVDEVERQGERQADERALQAYREAQTKEEKERAFKNIISRVSR